MRRCQQEKEAPAGDCGEMKMNEGDGKKTCHGKESRDSLLWTSLHTSEDIYDNRRFVNVMVAKFNLEEKKSL